MGMEQQPLVGCHENGIKVASKIKQSTFIGSSMTKRNIVLQKRGDVDYAEKRSAEE